MNREKQAVSFGAKDQAGTVKQCTWAQYTSTHWHIYEQIHLLHEPHMYTLTPYVYAAVKYVRLQGGTPCHKSHTHICVHVSSRSALQAQQSCALPQCHSRVLE